VYVVSQVKVPDEVPEELVAVETELVKLVELDAVEETEEELDAELVDAEELVLEEDAVLEELAAVLDEVEVNEEVIWLEVRFKAT
jgi:hypothetical protein